MNAAYSSVRFGSTQFGLVKFFLEFFSMKSKLARLDLLHGHGHAQQPPRRSGIRHTYIYTYISVCIYIYIEIL